MAQASTPALVWAAVPSIKGESGELWRSGMHDQAKMAILINDLDSMCWLIEDLPAHVALTNAGELLKEAKNAIAKARVELHQSDLARRYDI